MTPEQRRRDRGVRRTPVYEGLPPLWSGDDPFIVAAKSIVGREQRGVRVSFLEDEQAVDAIGVCLLAMLERRDPVKAVARWYDRERRWVNVTKRMA
jgi:hypothetical protein